MKQYMAFVEATGHAPPGCGRRLDVVAPDLPVTCVSARDGAAYVAWLTERSGKTWWMPTEPEWEWAARAGSSGRYSAGMTLAAEAASVGMADGRPVSVAESAKNPPNALGLVGIHGNVAELAGGCWQDAPSHYRSNGKPRHRGDCGYSPLRDAAWFEPVEAARSSNRRAIGVDERRPGVGLRVAREL